MSCYYTDLDQMIPNVELVRAILQYVQVSSFLNFHFLCYIVHMQTQIHTNNYKSEISYPLGQSSAVLYNGAL